jgi:excinuclease ABC subunit C
VHRFVITRHRKARKSKLLTSSLEEIQGIGKKRRLALLKYFGSLEAINKASLEEIAQVKGFNRDLAEKIKEFLSAG